LIKSDKNRVAESESAFLAFQRVSSDSTKVLLCKLNQ
jgi:hypothetical protein